MLFTMMHQQRTLVRVRLLLFEKILCLILRSSNASFCIFVIKATLLHSYSIHDDISSKSRIYVPNSHVSELRSQLLFILPSVILCFSIDNLLRIEACVSNPQSKNAGSYRAVIGSSSAFGWSLLAPRHEGCSRYIS